MMKVFGILAGRKTGNCEILAKEALMAAVEVGDEWYVKVHAPEVCEQHGLKRFFSFSAVDPTSMVGPFVRVSELWYSNHSSWRKAILENPPKYTKPSWSNHDRFPFLKPEVDFVSTFLLERPECDFLKDYRGYNITA